MANLALNPYQNVNWETVNQYKSNFHTHKDLSDGSCTPKEMIDIYHNAGYDILAITEHNHLTSGTTYPWTTYGKDPAVLNMLAVQGSELSVNHHRSSLFSDYNSDNGIEKSFVEISARDGLSIIHHPTRYSYDIGWYINLLKYDCVVGVEAYNKGDRYPDGRELWDKINCISNRMLWGYSNTDDHNGFYVGKNYQFILMTELTEIALKTAMREGAFFFCYEPAGTGTVNVPTITSITVDTNTITIQDANISYIDWVSEAGKIGTGRTFNYGSFRGKFVRAELKNNNGITYTQPFSFTVQS